MFAILKSSERKVADVAVERAPNTSSKPVRMPVGMYGGGYSYGGGNNFFDWMFGGPQGGSRPYPPRNIPPPPRNNGRFSWR
jgi:L,D-transpeptidase YcbB